MQCVYHIFFYPVNFTFQDNSETIHKESYKQFLHSLVWKILIPPLNIYPGEIETYVYTKIYKQICLGSLFIIAQNEQLKCSPTDKMK